MIFCLPAITRAVLPDNFSFYKLKFSFLCLSAIAVLSLIPGNQLPDTDIKYADLIVHVLMYAFLTVIVFWEIRQFHQASLRYVIIITLLIITYGAIIEVLQENLIEGRYGSWSDFIANSFGCLFALFLNQKLIRN